MILKFRGPVPTYATAGSGGFDLRTADNVWLAPGEARPIATGLEIELPDGTVGLVRGRSGLAFKSSVYCVGGTVDADYRGEIKVLLRNESKEGVYFKAGDRIAQLVIVPYVRPELVESAELGQTERGESGFGSSGLS